MEQKDIKIIGSAQKCLQILSYMADINNEVSITELVDALKINKSTMHHYLTTLVLEKYVLQNPDNKKYRIGPEAFRVGESYLRKDFPYQEIDNILRLLHNEVDENVCFYIYSGNKVTCVLNKGKISPYNIHSSIGTSIPMHASAAGKVFLAFMEKEKRESILNQTGLPGYTKYTITDYDVLLEELKEIRLRNYAENDREHDETVAVSVPVFGFGEKIIAAAAVTGPYTRMTDKKVKDVIKIMLKYGQILSEKVHNVVL